MDLDYYIGLEYPIQLEKDSDTSEYMASIPGGEEVDVKEAREERLGL